eukprot:GHVT01013809.1.p1 GENE.GHVT01013809.1~~GHVT01013809.1.p1  ORF type:complete len:1049 (+),score=113.09 GHVT01013809.1:254-3148(+)
MTSTTPGAPHGAVVSGSGSATATVEKSATTTVTLRHTKEPKETIRLDYKAPEFLIDKVYLDFDLEEENTKVIARLTMRRRPETPPCNLVLFGEELSLTRVEVDGTRVNAAEGCAEAAAGATGGSGKGYSLSPSGDLTIPSSALPSEADLKFELETEVQINPTKNLTLMGLYKSGKLFCTQCEAEGFRRITYFLDRPDVMSLYKVRVSGLKSKVPVLLSNGNLISSGDVEGTNGARHFAVFEDPHRKPCYLFALVAGQLEKISDTFTTMSGRSVEINIFSEPEDSSKLSWALQSVKKSMKWDEEEYGREYDLDVFHVVCAKDFNMGAMENKGLNVFNASLLLADPNTATDAEYQRILNVIGHEYFHNWTGNRVTCRDWFQLTLKEGLTVFRDQQFTSAMTSATVKRTDDVRFIRGRQFTEDAGPMSHPIRPESYIAVDNFYTATVYDKGAEVIRMYHTLLGKEGFRKGMDLYFATHDGQAVTCDDFRKAMEKANNKDLTQFERWYLQAGTPLVTVEEAKYDPSSSSYSLRLRQFVPPTPKQPTKLPMHIPVRMGLVGKVSKKDLLNPPNRVLELTEEVQEFKLEGVTEEPVLSIFRDFSAPVKVLNPSETVEDLAFLMGYDSDGLNRWVAAQTLGGQIILDRAEKLRGMDELLLKEKTTEDKKKKMCQLVDALPPLTQIYVDAFKAILLAKTVDKSMQACSIGLKDASQLHQEMPSPVDPVAVAAARNSVRKDLFRLLSSEILSLYESLTLPPGSKETLEREDVDRRRLRNALLPFIAAPMDKTSAKILYKHYTNATTMTDRMEALYLLVHQEEEERDVALKHFFEEAKGDSLVLDKWFRVQGFSRRDNCIEEVCRLREHPSFTLKNPNRLRALFFAFANNDEQFHRIDGEGYRVLTDVVIEVDKFNPSIAARGCSYLLNWKQFDSKRQNLMTKQLQRVKNEPGISPESFEIAAKGLAALEEPGK